MPPLNKGGAPFTVPYLDQFLYIRPFGTMIRGREPLPLKRYQQPHVSTRPLYVGQRHVHDPAPFSLWDSENCRVRHTTREQQDWIDRTFEYSSMGTHTWFISLATNTLPCPLPLTLGGVPLYFVPKGMHLDEVHSLSLDTYLNPRLPDPCLHLRWEKMTFPPKHIHDAILKYLKEDLGLNVKGIVYLPLCNIVELEIGDGKRYGVHSLPAHVAGRGVWYHHSPFGRFAPRVNLMRRVGNDLEVGSRL